MNRPGEDDERERAPGVGPLSPAQVQAGQTYRLHGATIHIDEVAEDGSGARITVRQDGVTHPWQKWQPLDPWPHWLAEAELISDPAADAVQAAAAEIASLP